MQSISPEEEMRAIFLQHLHESEERCLKQIVRDTASRGKSHRLVFMLLFDHSTAVRHQDDHPFSSIQYRRSDIKINNNNLKKKGGGRDYPH